MQVNLAEMEGIEIKASGGSSRQFCLCGGDSETSTFYIIPTIIGEVDIEATVSLDIYEIQMNYLKILKEKITQHAKS